MARAPRVAPQPLDSPGMANSSTYFDDTYQLAFLDPSLGWAVSPADEAAYSVPVIRAIDDGNT
jgi:hypothetical protein